MPIVPAKCPQCGADIEVDTTHEAGLCKNCGAPFVTEKVLKSQNIFITNNNDFSGASINIVSGASSSTDFANFLNIALKALDAHEGAEALKYANKALEINSVSSEAWVVKMKSMTYLATFTDPKVNETTEYGKNAITYAPVDKKTSIEDIVYSHYLQRTLSLFSIMNERIRDTVSIQNALTELKFNAPFGAEQRINAADSNNITILNQLNGAALLLKISIPTESISQNSNYQKAVLEICNQYVKYIDGLQDRYAIYKANFSEEARKAHKAELVMLEAGLTPIDCQSIPDFRKNPNVSSNSGCYIATCVYGSYDCPQVWTLRRFRDDTLDATWYGRLFIRCYYAISPTLVKWFGNTTWFKKIWRGPLDSLVTKLKHDGVSATFYHDRYYFILYYRRFQFINASIL